MSNSVLKIRSGREQFRGVFTDVWYIEASVDYDSIGTNDTGWELIPVPGLDPKKDIVIGFNRDDEVADHGHFEVCHVHTNGVHVGLHNVTGGPYDHAAATYIIVVGRVRK